MTKTNSARHSLLGMLPAMMSQGAPHIADVGMVGGGQLARMTAQAAIPLGVRLRVLAARADDSAALIWPDVDIGSPDDAETLSDFAAGCQVVTFDHELVPPDALTRLDTEGACLRPSSTALAFAQDKQLQRDRLDRLGFPVPPHRIATRPEEITAFADIHGWPLVVKTPRGGYDGRGVWIVEDLGQSEQTIGQLGRTVLIEPWLRIDREIAVIVARRPGGQTRVYPVVETVQEGGICRVIYAPAPITHTMHRKAEQLAVSIADAIGVTGVMAVELFVADERLIVNELATRPHNSGHYTIEGCITSQFEQHLRAVLDWPLGTTDLTAPAVVTVNILGGSEGADPRAALPQALEIPGVHVHLYDKEVRPGRKLGHVTVRGNDISSAREQAVHAASTLTGTTQEIAR